MTRRDRTLLNYIEAAKKREIKEKEVDDQDYFERRKKRILAGKY